MQTTLVLIKGVPGNMTVGKSFWMSSSIYYSETPNNEYIERIYQMSSSQFFNEFYTGGGHNSPNFAWLGVYCTVKFVEKCFLMTELVS